MNAYRSIHPTSARSAVAPAEKLPTQKRRQSFCTDGIRAWSLLARFGRQGGGVTPGDDLFPASGLRKPQPFPELGFADQNGAIGGFEHERDTSLNVKAPDPAADLLRCRSGKDL